MGGADIEARVLAAADELFYARGISDVGVKELRQTADVSLNGLYGRFGSKDGVIVEYLNRRHASWIGSLSAAVMAHEQRAERLDALFAWLGDWFAQPQFNGCAFINARAEASALDSRGIEMVEGHSADLRALLGEIAWGELDADALFLLVEGAIVTAQAGDRDAAGRALRMALRLAS